MVEVEGARTLLPACATQAAPGMVVQTESPRVVAARKTVIELLLASGNHNCLVCEANGECELQALAYRYQVATPDFANPPDTPYYYEDDNRMIVRDFSKCVMCGRCVRACNERQVNQAIAIGYRGAHNKIVARGDYPYIDSDCVFCGECLQACPVGAITDKHAGGRGRPWERTQVRTTCPYCGVGCQVDVHVKDGRMVKVTGADAIPNKGKLCVKGRFGWRFVDHPDRLKTPLIKENGVFREATWDEALDLAASRLKEIRDKEGPEKIGGWYLGPGDQRRKLPDAEAHAGGDRHQSRRSLRPSLTQLHGGRSGRLLRLRCDDQFHRRVGERRLYPGHGLQHHGDPSRLSPPSSSGRRA